MNALLRGDVWKVGETFRQQAGTPHRPRTGGAGCRYRAVRGLHFGAIKTVGES